MRDPHVTPRVAENRATFARLTCNRKQAGRDLQSLRQFLRDVHCPLVARRPHIWDYRTGWLDPVDPTLMLPIDGAAMDCPEEEHLQFYSDVRWLDRAAQAAFAAAITPEVVASMVADVHMLVGESTVYDVIDDNGWTFLDRSGDPTPIGPVAIPTYALMLRSGEDLDAFRDAVDAVCGQWATQPEVVRLRMNLLERNAAQSHAGGPVRPHPVERQYHAMIDVQVTDGAALKSLDARSLAGLVEALHVYPISHVFSWCCAGRPTLAGLRGVAAAQAIADFDAQHQASPDVLRWMYGDVLCPP